MKLLTLRSFGWFFLWCFASLLATSIIVTLVFRWAPVPWSSLMIQRQMAAIWQGDERFRLVHPWVCLEQISLYVPLAVIAAEDQKFFAHHGFDFDAMSHALQVNQYRRRPLGASTISQQLAKNLFLWPGRTFLRKGVEAASYTYFHKPAARLTASEAAQLAAILPSPLRSDLAHPTSYIRGRGRHIERQMKLMGGGSYLKEMVLSFSR